MDRLKSLVFDVFDLMKLKFMIIQTYMDNSKGCENSQIYEMNNITLNKLHSFEF